MEASKRFLVLDTEDNVRSRRTSSRQRSSRRRPDSATVGVFHRKESSRNGRTRAIRPAACGKPRLAGSRSSRTGAVTIHLEAGTLLVSIHFLFFFFLFFSFISSFPSYFHASFFIFILFLCFMYFYYSFIFYILCFFYFFPFSYYFFDVHILYL
jgi:ABC-type multidrug transport system permease subunit